MRVIGDASVEDVFVVVIVDSAPVVGGCGQEGRALLFDEATEPILCVR
jgi:hypothetical protein